MKLYEIANIYSELMDRAFAEAEENEGVIDDELAEALEAVADQYQDKIHNCGLYYKNAIAEADAIKAEKDKLAAREKSARNRAEWIKKYIASCVQSGVKREFANLRISWSKSTETVISDESLIPSELCKIKVEPSKTEIKKMILSGVDVPGAQLVEKLNLQIK